MTSIPSGNWAGHVHAFLSGAATNRTISLTMDVYSRSSSGTETLIGQSASSSALTTTESEIDFSFNTSTIPVASTDRIVARISATISGGAFGLPTVNVRVAGVTDARLELPASTSDLSNLIPYTGANSDVNLGSHILTTTGINWTSATGTNTTSTNLYATNLLFNGATGSNINVTGITATTGTINTIGFVNATGSNLYVSGLIQTGTIMPIANNTYNLGSASTAWANVYASGTGSAFFGITWTYATGTNTTSTNL